MISMKSAIVLFVSSVISCLFFTLGRWVGRVEKKQEARIPKPREKRKKTTLRYDDGVIDAEYEDVVDLQEYRLKKTYGESTPVNYEWMFSKSENTYVKVPREIAELIKTLNKEF